MSQAINRKPGATLASVIAISMATMFITISSHAMARACLDTCEVVAKKFCTRDFRPTPTGGCYNYALKKCRDARSDSAAPSPEAAP